MSHDPSPRDLAAADRLNLFGANAPLGASIREAAALQMAALERSQQKPTQDDIDTRWSTFYCEHVYYGSASACRAAKGIAIERAHAAALREETVRQRERQAKEVAA